MKKLWVAGYISMLAFACNPKVNTISSTNVPDRVITSFYERYPNAREVDWKLDNGLYKAGFKTPGGADKAAFFRPDGTMIRVEQ